MRNGAPSGGSGPARRVAALALAALCLAAAVSGPVAAAGAAQNATDAESRTVVTLQADGDAEVALTVAFDLTTATEEEAFESIRENETERDELRAEYGDRMAAVAASASNATDREMGVDDPSIAFETTDGGDRGLVVLTITWTNLAAVDEGSLRVDEPFASGFAYDGTVTVVAPEGYELASTSPAPEESTDRRATWSASDSLEGFEVVAEGDAGRSASSDRLPGFGAPVAAAALAAGLGLVARRRREA